MSTQSGETTQRIPLTWTDHMLDVFTKQAEPAYSDIGRYLVRYSWMDSTATAVQASGTKYVTIVPPLSLTYYLGYEPGGGASSVYYVDSGAYYNTQTISQRTAYGKLLPATNPARYGYDFAGWKYLNDQSKPFDATTPIIASTDASGYIDTVINLVASWESHKHAIKVIDEEGVLAEVLIKDVPFASNVSAAVDGSKASLGAYLTEYFLGWKIVEGLPGREGQMLTGIQTMPDNEVIIAPLYGESDIQGKKTARNLTQGGIAADVYNRVGDVIEFELAFSNPAEFKWTVTDIIDNLNEGLSFVSGSISLTRPDGPIIPVSDSVFDETSNTLRFEDDSGIELIAGESCILTFQVTLNSVAPDQEIIKNQGYIEGLDADGNPDGPYFTDEITLPGNGQALFVDADKWVLKSAENTTNPSGGKAQIGDIIRYSIEMGNKSTDPNSAWNNGWVYDQVPEGLQVISWTIEMTYKAVLPWNPAKASGSSGMLTNVGDWSSGLVASGLMSAIGTLVLLVWLLRRRSAAL